MRKEVFALAVIGLMIVSAVAGYLAGAFIGSRQTTTTSTTLIALPASVCNTPIPPLNGTGTTRVYKIALESIGVICVNYEFQGNGSYSFSPTDYGPQISSGSAPWFACGAENGSSVAAACSDLTITPSQPSINHPTSQNITVAYSVQSNDSPGIFWFFIGSCNAIPIAIGESPSFVAYPGFGCLTTPGAPTSVTVTGTWNVNVTEAPNHAPLP